MRGALAFLVLAMAGTSAQGQPSCNTDSDFKGSKDPAEIAVLQSLKGTVALGGKSRCSAALVTFLGRSASAKALVLSAGHCSEQGKADVTVGKNALSMPDHGEVLYRVSSGRALTLETGNPDEPRTCVQEEEITYGTMTGADIMLMQISETYEQIAHRTGVRPFLVSQEKAFSPGLALRVPSARWQNDRACEVDATVETLKEARWLWGPVLRIRIGDTCGTPHGASGSPGIRKDTSEVIGVFGTASDGDAAPCEMNNSCEVASDGSTKVSVRGQGYFHFVHNFYTCLDVNRNVDLAVPGCLLPKPQR